MARTVSYGPNGTAVSGVSSVTFPVAPLNFAADFRKLSEGPGLVVYTDVTSPQDQPSTLRIAQSSRSNVYAGTSIDPSVFLPTKQGTDTIVEIREVWSESDSTDSTYLRMFPVRLALTLTTPNANQVSIASIERLVARAIAALAAQGKDTLDEGVSALLHGVVQK